MTATGWCPVCGENDGIVPDGSVRWAHCRRHATKWTVPPEAAPADTTPPPEFAGFDKVFGYNRVEVTR